MRMLASPLHAVQYQDEADTADADPETGLEYADSKLHAKSKEEDIIDLPERSWGPIAGVGLDEGVEESFGSAVFSMSPPWEQLMNAAITSDVLRLVDQFLAIQYMSKTQRWIHNGLNTYALTLMQL